MLKKIKSRFSLSLVLLAAICVFFYACKDDESITPTIANVEQTIFQKYQTDHTQDIRATDLGEGTYEVIGQAGTVIEIKNALVHSNGDRVRGDIELELVEIYSVPEMILHRKQTLSDDNGRIGILESGGEIFLKVYQNGTELQLDGAGTMRVLLPTENTGGAKENMELYYGEAVGAQVIWKPTGEKVRVINSINRNGSFYEILIQNILGWVNVDRLNELQGSELECINVVVDCDDICSGGKITASIYVNGLNSAFEVPATGPNSFQLCGPFPMGGIQVSFIVTLECPDGRFYAAINTVTLNAPIHDELFDCGSFTEMQPDEFEQALQNLL